jgi:hypothetical protein
MSEHGSGRARPMSAGAFNFTIEVSHADDQATIESFFRDLPNPPHGAPCEPIELIRSEARNEDGEQQWTLAGPRLDDRPTVPIVGALLRLMSAVNLSALDAEPGALHLHAAAAARNGRAIIIAAERNTGKTTTVSHLVKRGWSFITDETVILTADSPDVGGFPKPLSIKPGGFDLVPHLVAHAIPAIVDDRPSFHFVPVGATGARVAASATPHLTVLLRRDPMAGDDAAPSSRRLRPADAVVALMQETLDAGRYGNAALRLAQLAVASNCYEVTVGSPEATAEHLEELMSNLPAESVDVTLLPDGPHVAKDVVSVEIGDAIVVHEQSNGGIFALDSAAARIWRHVGGWNVDDAIDITGPVVAPFVNQLRSLGVLAEVA